MTEIWITYTVKYGSGHQLDPVPKAYENIALFTSEIEALRWANSRNAKCIPIQTGQTLEHAIKLAYPAQGMGSRG